jgi:hypothetical protein
MFSSITSIPSTAATAIGNLAPSMTTLAQGVTNVARQNTAPTATPITPAQFAPVKQDVAARIKGALTATAVVWYLAFRILNPRRRG